MSRCPHFYVFGVMHMGVSRGELTRFACSGVVQAVSAGFVGEGDYAPDRAEMVHHVFQAVAPDTRLADTFAEVVFFVVQVPVDNDLEIDDGVESAEVMNADTPVLPGLFSEGIYRFGVRRIVYRVAASIWVVAQDQMPPLFTGRQKRYLSSSVFP